MKNLKSEVVIAWCIYLEGLREVPVRTVALRLSGRIPDLRKLVSSLGIECNLPGNVSNGLCWCYRY